ncbi:MAG TPA: DUF4214 domain-containing protein, partial [Ramlibacter sp.]|nr:DUF4214 domain-containing protein [Ramlibacter sp.]
QQAMYEVANPLTSPYSSICYIRCDWSDGTSTRASGVVIGVNDVLTALHVVYDASRGGWASRISIVPGADTDPFLTEPYGTYSDVGMLSNRSSDWDLNGDGLLTPQESEGDLALIGMESRIGDVTGWLPVAQVSNDFYGVMTGYPARGSGMMEEGAYADASFGYGVYDIDASLGAGASGGPLLYTSEGVVSVVGVLSSGNSGNTNSTYAGLFGTGTWDWLQAALVANDALIAGTGGGAPQAGGTLYTGTAAADAFTGTAGRDTFTGNAGDDVFDGAGALDTAVYSGSRSDYQVSISAGVIEVKDFLRARDGTDSLFNTERLKFTDVSVAFDVEGSAGQAYRLYQAAFNRTPDTGGLGFWINGADNGLSMSTMAQFFIDSPEFRATYGANLDNQQYVAQLYLNALNRALDQPGYDFWVGHLNAGNLSRAETLVFFSESPENQAQVIGTIENGMVYA